MIGRLNHVAIAVRDIAKASATYRTMLGAEVSAPQALPEHGVTVVFITLPNSKIELLEPLGAASPIAKFLEKNADGGIHHICCEVDDISRRARPAEAGRRAGAGDGEPKIGAHGKPVLFLHPKISRRAARTRTGVSHGFRISHRPLFRDLVDHAVHGAAVRRALATGSRRGGGWQRSRRAVVRPFSRGSWRSIRHWRSWFWRSSGRSISRTSSI